ncbi:MAG TPA: DNA translocase FtsK 4TM domain-containing protein [Syntrophomonadaceae bacterium]|nr:DNA translocase FtsK 4TM domain-containing protein [Syntrophomonadaceae bacterium]
MPVTKKLPTKTKKSPKKSVKKDNSSKKIKNSAKSPKFNNIKMEIISLVIFVLSIFTYISVSKFNGIPEDIQFIGLLGRYIMISLEYILGEAGILVAFFMLFWSIHIGVTKELWSIRMWGISIITITVIVAIGIYDIPSGMTPWEAGQRGMGGGYLGGGIAFSLTKLLGQIGSAIILFLSGIIGLLMIVNQPIKEITAFATKSFKLIKEKVSNFFYYEIEDEQEDRPNRKKEKNQVLINNAPEETPLNLTPVFENKTETLPINKKADSYKPALVDEDLADDEKDIALKIDANNEYRKPSLDLLTDISSERTIDKKNIKQSIAVLEDTFSSFGILVKVNQVSCGPTVTRYELTPAPGVKISRILSLTDDLQLNLAAPGIRIEAPIPGKSAVGIEVPNSKVLSVGLKNLLQSSNFIKLKTPLAFALGEDITGNPVVARLNDMPHLLIAGSTGSGKSVCINSIIMSLIYNTTPDELKLVFIDPKMVELTVYNGIPHLLTPVVTNPKKAAVILKWMVTEMEKRYRLFAEKGVRDIARYNLVATERIPFIVIVIDELADLMMVAPVEVEDSICRLAQMARAAGMHLVVATQRPSVDVVTGIIKANIPSRIAFAVSSAIDSRTILDIGGAEKLLGKGDMLFFPVGAAKPYRVQGAFVSDSDIDRTVAFIKEQAQPKQEPEPFEEIEASLVNAELEEDDLFWEAVSVFVEGQKASVSLLQRRLRIGYARAARLVDTMEDRGIVSELKNNRTREILIDNEQFDKLYASRKLC